MNSAADLAGYFARTLAAELSHLAAISDGPARARVSPRGSSSSRRTVGAGSTRRPVRRVSGGRRAIRVGAPLAAARGVRPCVGLPHAAPRRPHRAGCIVRLDGAGR